MTAMEISQPPSPEERERELVEASERYMGGMITREQFEEIEERDRLNYREAARAIVRARYGWCASLASILPFMR